MWEKTDLAKKRVKMRNINSLVISEDSNIHNSKAKETDEQLSQVTIGSVSSDRMDLLSNNASPVEMNPIPNSVDLSRVSNSIALEAKPCSMFSDKPSKYPSVKGIQFDLNAEDVASSGNMGSIHHFRRCNSSKSCNVSECGSTSGSASIKDPLTVWKEMKENGFLSTSQSGILLQGTGASPSNAGIPSLKQREQKSKAGIYKKRMEMGKKYHVDKVAKSAPPSGLLNGLNLGIINHVRNKKQVHSIIQALVKSENLNCDNPREADESFKRCSTKQKLRAENPGKRRVGCSAENVGFSALSEEKQKNAYPAVTTSAFDSSKVDEMDVEQSIPHFSGVKDVEPLNWKDLPFDVPECYSTLESDSANISKVSLLSIRASSVAARWLELLNQDIKGRLLALRRSKKRVRSVITTELPFLVSKEYASGSGHDDMPSELKDDSVASSHMSHWGQLFGQMDKALSDEERQLENWLRDVKEMQARCEHGLQNSRLASFPGSHEGSEYGSRKEAIGLAVRAAAASIYSTCNFLMSKENSPLYLSSH